MSESKNAKTPRVSPLFAAVRSRDIAAVGYLLGWRLLRWLPRSATQWLFRWGADVACDDGRGMDQLRANLSRIVGPCAVTRSLVRDSMRSYARYWWEAFMLPAMAHDVALRDRLVASVEGLDGLDAAVASGRGVVVVLPHSGNWDMAGVLMCHRYGTFTTVAERLRPEVLFEEFVRFRRGLGFDVLPLTGGPAPFPVLSERLKAGEIVCLLGERDLKHNGVEVTFFNETTRMPAGPVRLAQETGAVLLVGHSYFTANGWGFRVSEPVPVTELSETVQRVADIFERNIAEHPEDWHMLQPQWLSDLSRGVTA